MFTKINGFNPLQFGNWDCMKTVFFLQSQNPVQIDLVTIFDAILTSGQTREKLQCLYENLISNNFRRTAVLKIILLHEKFGLEQ